MELEGCSMTKSLSIIIMFVLSVSIFDTGAAKEGKIYWGSEVPEGWNGTWPEKFLTVAEKYNFKKTSFHRDILEYFAALKWNSENVHIFSMFTSDLQRNCPVIVMANPRITSARQAKASGKTIIYLQGSIHPNECEGKEALLMLMRDILFGQKKYWLDNLVILCCPSFNVDGNDTAKVDDYNPVLTGTNSNAQGYNLNRDAIKVESTDMQAAYQKLFHNWDPTIILDTHQMERARHGYAIVYAASNVPTAHPGPRGYVTHQIFPALRQAARRDGSIEIFFHAGLDRNWPPREFTHDNAIWSVEGKFMVSAYGLRNRMSILVETPGYESYEKRIFSQYIFARELLEYTYAHGKEMQKVCQSADEDTVNKILNQAASGQLRNFVDGKYESYGKVDIYAYQKLEKNYFPGTSVRRRSVGPPDAPPVLCRGVELVTKPVGTKEAMVPRGYLIPANLEFIIEKLRIHNIKINVLDKTIVVSGEEFIIDKLVHIRKNGFNMTRLEGGFFKSQRKEFPAGTFHIDMAQPLANMAFYCLEPEIGDGFVGWNLFNDYLYDLGVKNQSVVYPIYKYLKTIE